MNAYDTIHRSRRRFLGTAAAVSLVVAGQPLAAPAADKMKIGIVGSGRIGGTLGEFWLKAGHEVMFSSLDLDHDKMLAARLGGGARAGTPVYGKALTARELRRGLGLSPQ